MPTYILLSTLTSEGRQTLLDHPDRLELVNKEISELGCKVIAQYAVLGPYDFVTTIDAPTTRLSLNCRLAWAREVR